MRNLKRALSLALASVMLLGMMVVGTSASYADVDASKNVEAIEVLQAVGVMTGDENGNFNPDKAVTRNEMAVVMVNLLGLTAGGTTPFTDVPTWAQPYVAACYNNGIIAGTSATTFGGSDNVTAVQSALMIMKALGYFQYQGEFGDSWELSVVKQANKINLYDGVDAYVTKQMNRNEIAQMVLNALESNVKVITENGGMSVSGDGFTVNQKPTYSEADAANNSGNDYRTVGGDSIMQLAEKLYGNNLKKAVNTHDAMQRPAAQWTYKGKTITSAASPKATYTAQVALKDVYKALNLATSTTAVVYENGKDAYSVVSLSSSNSTKIGGNGTVLEFYVNSSNVVEGVKYNEFVVEAVANYNTTTEKLAVSDWSGKSLPTEIKAEDFPIVKDAKKGDYLLVTAANDGAGNWSIKTVKFAEKVTDVTVSEYKNGSYAIANGTKYSYNAYAASSDTGALGYSLLNAGFGTGNLNSTKYDLILDSYGYVIGVKGASSVATLDNYLFVKQAAQSGFQYLAKVLFMDGTTKTVTVAKTAANAGTLTAVTSTGDGSSASDGVLNAHCWYTFNVNKNGEYELTAAPVIRQVQGTALNGSSAQPITGAAYAYVASNDTVFVADTSRYVGIKNAPTVASGAVYGLGDDSGFLMAAYAVNAGSNTASASDFVYVISADGSGKDADGNTYYNYTAVVNGEKTTLKSVDSGKGLGLYEITQYTDGYANLGTAITVSGSRVGYGTSAGNTYITHKNGAVNLNGTAYVLADDALIYTVDATDADKPVKVLTSGDQLNSLDIGSYTWYAVNVSTSNAKIAVLALVQYA